MFTWFKIGFVGLVLIGAFGSGWKTEGWRLDDQLQTAKVAYETNLKAISDAAARADADQLAKIAELQQTLATSDAQHQKEMNDANKEIAAAKSAANGGLSVLAQCPDRGTGGASVSTTTSTSGMVHGAVPGRAILDKAVAQRLLALVAAGDRALIKLQACQNYVHDLQTVLSNNRN